MSWGFVAVGAATLVGGAIQSHQANKAQKAQNRASQHAIDVQNQQFAKMTEMLAPYREGGEQALNAQNTLLGLNGQAEQQAAIDNIAGGAQFQGMVQQGEDAILQNAAATGGLRGGNVQGALAQFRPQMLNNAVQQQFANLGGITNLGQNAAAGSGSAAMANANAVGNIFQQQGANNAGYHLAQGNIVSGALGQMGGLASQYAKRPKPAGTF